MSRTLIDRNSDTGKRSSPTSICEHCDECLTAGRSKLNGGFSRVADPGLKAAALAMSGRARAFRRSTRARLSTGLDAKMRYFKVFLATPQYDRKRDCRLKRPVIRRRTRSY